MAKTMIELFFLALFHVNVVDLHLINYSESPALIVDLKSSRPGEGGIRTRGPLILRPKLRIPVKRTVLIFSNLEFRAFPAATYSSSVGSVHVQQFS